MLANLILGLVEVVNMLLSVYIFIIFFAALISWVNPDPYNPIVKFLHAVTEPVLRPIRRLIGARLGMIDFSPLIVILIIVLFRAVVLGTIVDIALRMK